MAARKSDHDPKHKRFHDMDPTQRRDYIDWVDRWYRYHYCGDIPRPSAEPIFWDAAETDDTRRRYTWTAAEAIAWLGIDPKALPGYVNGLPDPLPHRKDVLRRSHFDPAEVRAWANRRGIRARSRNAA